MIKLWMTLIALAMTLTAGVSQPAMADATAATQPSPDALPQTPGFHDLMTTVSINGKQRQLPYTVYLPKNYDPAKKWPLVIFLLGGGARGDDHRGIYHDGPMTALRTDKSLADWAPFIVIAPACPADERWEAPGMPEMVAGFVPFAKQNWSVDADRVYLTGLSMGGFGSWHVALAAPAGTFAAVAVMSAIAVEPDKMPTAVQGSEVLIICGATDAVWFEQGSHQMNQALKDHGVDVTFVELPGLGHILWEPYYDSRTFYEFLLAKTRGQPASTRPSADQLLAVGLTKPNSADSELQQPLQKFAQWWYIANCGRDHSPGLNDEAMGRKNVFVTTPLGEGVPCRLMITTPIPADKKTTLNMTVAADPKGKWELVVRAEQKDIFTQTIDGKPAGGNGPWVDASVDLSAYAGKTINLQLLDNTAGAENAVAYWGKVEVVSR